MLRLVIWPSMTLLGWTETKLWTLKYGSKSIQTSLILRKRPPKPYKLLKFFISFVTTVKSCHAPSIWKKMRWKSLCLLILKSITEIIKYFKSLYDFGGRRLKIKDVCMDFEPYIKVHNLISVHPKSVILGQMTNLNMVFHMVVSVYRLVKILKLAPVPWWISERLMIGGALGCGVGRPWFLKKHVHEFVRGMGEAECTSISPGWARFGLVHNWEMLRDPPGTQTLSQRINGKGQPPCQRREKTLPG